MDRLFEFFTGYLSPIRKNKQCCQRPVHVDKSVHEHGLASCNEKTFEPTRYAAENQASKGDNSDHEYVTVMITQEIEVTDDETDD